MTETTDTTDDGPTASQSPAGSDTPDSQTGSEMSVFDQLQWGAMVLLVVIALWATAQFYLSATRAIDVWVGAGYQPLVMAAFNLALLLGAVAGISLLARRLGTVPT